MTSSFDELIKKLDTGVDFTKANDVFDGLVTGIQTAFLSGTLPDTATTNDAKTSDAQALADFNAASKTGGSGCNPVAAGTIQDELQFSSTLCAAAATKLFTSDKRSIHSTTGAGTAVCIEVNSFDLTIINDKPNFDTRYGTCATF